MFERTNSPRELTITCSDCGHSNRLTGGGLHASDPVHCAKCRKYLGTLIEIQFNAVRPAPPAA